MKEIRDIIVAYNEADMHGKMAALATVVHVEGSSYRQPGARMLITEDGMLTGAISGGCLEGDALRKALLVMSEKRTMLVTYDTNDEDDAMLGMGLGCNGVIQVLIEYINKDNPANPIALLKAVAAKRQPAVLVTTFFFEDRKKTQPGTCLLLQPTGITSNGHEPAIDQLLPAAKKAMNEKVSSLIESSSKDIYRAYIEYIPPPLSLVIIGAGNDVKPLATMAGMLGWDVTIVDGRTNYAKPERFPSCSVILSKPGEVLTKMDVDEQTVFAVMTHNYSYDLAMMRELLNRNVRYIGLLGPKKKRERMLQELNEQGVFLTEEQHKTIHGPIGLDIGAETAEEIALSILAEIKAVLTGKEGKQLRDKSEPIHSREAASEEKPGRN